MCPRTCPTNLERKLQAQLHDASAARSEDRIAVDDVWRAATATEMCRIRGIVANVRANHAAVRIGEVGVPGLTMGVPKLHAIVRMSAGLLRCLDGHFCRASATISTRTVLASPGLVTSRENGMRTPRMPSGVFKRTWKPSRSTEIIVTS